jgi:hypothetical protein
MIDDLMNEKAGSRDLDDAEIVDAEPEVIELSDCEEKPVNRKAVNLKVVKTEKSASGTGPVARRPAADRIHTDSTRSRARNDSQNLLANISKVLDPNLRHARADDQSVNAMQTGQIFSLSSQLREAQRQTEALRNQLAEAERRCHNADRRADRAELMGMISGSRGPQNFTRRPPSPGPPRVGRQPGRRSSHRRFRQEIYYGDGGRSTRYLASDDDDAEIQGDNDSPGTRRYTFEESSDHSPTSSKPSGSFLPTPSSQDSDDPPMMIVPPTGTSLFKPEIDSPLRYPSLEV